MIVKMTTKGRTRERILGREDSNLQLPG